MSFVDDSLLFAHYEGSEDDHEDVLPLGRSDSSMRVAHHDGGNDTYLERLSSIQTAASHDKRQLLGRIEEMAAIVRRCQGELSRKNEELEGYHRVFGTLDDFSTRQVRLREELVHLRESVRSWQTKEMNARDECRNLRKVIESLKRGSRHENAESRLAELEDKLALAHVQRADLKKEVEDILALEAQRRLRTETGTQLDWQVRGKVADLQRQAKQNEDLINSLQSAVDSIVAVSGSQRFQHIGDVNRRCPGCNEPQWVSPFCPQTGHKHSGFSGPEGKAPTRSAEPVQPAKPRPAPSPILDSDVERRAREALEAKEWIKLVQVGSYAVTFKHVQTNRVVDDLHAAIREDMANAQFAELSKWEAENQRRREDEDQSRADLERSQVEDEARKKLLDGQPNVRPSMKNEVVALLEELKLRTAENNKLKALLKKCLESGKLAHHSAPETKAAAPPQEKKDKKDPVLPINGAAAADATVVPLHDEDEVMTETKLRRLEEENSQLNKRCTELILALTARDEQIGSLQETVKSKCMTDGDEQSLTSTLRRELAMIRDRLLQEERRSIALSDEVARLRRFEPMTTTFRSP